MKKRLCFLTLALLTIAGLSSWAAQPKTNEGEEPFKIGGTSYSTLEAAINAVEENGTITMTKAVSDAKGISVPSNKNFTVDFGGHTYTCASDPAGSTGTQNQVFQLLKGSTIIFKNGKINVAESAKEQFRFIIQNYANLTLEGMTLDGTNLGFTGKVCYAVSNNSGTVEFKDFKGLDESTQTTNITAPAGGIAFDVCKYASYEVPTVTVNTTGTITGQVEVTGGNLVVTSGTFTNSGEVLNVSSGKVTVNGGNFTAGNVAVWVEGKGEKTADVTLAGGSFTSQESTVVFRGENDQIKITGGEYTSKDNAVIAGNGSNDRTYGNTVTISGGTFNGGITTSGYIACGIYAPWKDNITVNGGTFNITNGAGVVARAGVVTIDGGIFNCTGTNTAGWVGDNKNSIPCECLVFDAAANYPAKDANSKIVVNGGTFSDMSGVNYVADNATYTLGANVDNAKGMIIDTEKTFTLDFGGHTYTVNKPGAGSTNTQTQAFQLIAGQNITFKNGTIKAADANLNATSEGDVKPIKRFIQNYANLTLTNMTFDGTNINGENSVVEFCNGNVTIDGTTNFTAKSGVASINVDSWKGSYPNGTAVTINTTGNVGKIHCYTEGTGSMTTKSSLTIKNGKNITIDDVSNGEVVISIEGGTFSDLSGVKYVADNATYTLGANVDNAKGMVIDTKKTFTLDFGGHTYTVNKPGAGSQNTQTSAFQLLKDQTITFRNGTIQCHADNKNFTWDKSQSYVEKGIAMLIQDYATLTLENMKIDGTNIAHNAYNGASGTVRYMVSSNYGNIDIKGNTSIIAPEGDIAFDVYDNKAVNGQDNSYPGVPTVTVNTTGTIIGQVEVTGGNLVVDAGQFTSNVCTILVKSGNVTVEGGTITSTGNAPVAVEGGNVTLKAGTYKGLEGAVIFPGEGATIDIQGGTYTATDNAVIAGNGSNNRTNGNTVTISGGTFNGGITTSGYIACGIYAPWKDNITVKGGTFNITGGAGVVARAGVVTINGGKFKVSDTGTGRVGDNTNQISCQCLVFDDDANYPAKDENSKIIVNGGLFSDDSAKDYLATGKSVVRNTDEDYLYAVVAAHTTESVEIAENVSISATEGTSELTDKQKETVTEAVAGIKDNTEVTTLPEETQEKNEAAVATVLTGDQSVRIAIELTGIVASVETNDPTVTFYNLVYDVTPYIVEDSEVARMIDNNDIKAPMTFRLPIPSSVTANYARVSHKHDGKTTDLGLKQIIQGTKGKYIEITTNSFSEFAVEMSDVEVNAPSTLYYYAGNSSKHSATLAEFLSDKANYANAIAFVDEAYANWASTQTNVVVIEKGTYSNSYYCPNFVLEDKVNFYTPVDFYVVNGSYTRTNTGGLNTVCLPFELSSADVNNGQIGVFHSTDMYNGDGLNESGNVYFNVVGNVNPGTPCIIKCSSTDAGWNIDLAGKTVAANPNNVNALKGSYETKDIGEGVYKVNETGTGFGKTGNSASVTAFRAYLDLTHDDDSGMGASGVKEFNIEWADDATGIENVKVASDSKVIYDLTGRMVNNPVKGGLYIINGKKVIFK